MIPLRQALGDYLRIRRRLGFELKVLGNVCSGVSAAATTHGKPARPGSPRQLPGRRQRQVPAGVLARRTARWQTSTPRAVWGQMESFRRPL